MGSRFLSRAFLLVVSFTICVAYDEYKNDLFEGDIDGIEEVPIKFNVSLPNNVQMAAPSRSAKKWPNGIVPYTFDDDFGDKWREKVREALAYFMHSVNVKGQQCIKFVQRTNERDYVKVFNGAGCYSNAGQKGGEQKISLKINGCFSRGTIVHEFMHALGFFHEHSRPDRDQWILIIKENVIDRNVYERNFQKYLTDSVDMSGPYDYGSVMHYDRKAFSKNGEDTVVPLKKGPKIGQRDGLSSNDIAQIRAYYGCNIKKTINWMIGNTENTIWANGCDFPGNELKQIECQAEECAQYCRNTGGCTHFTYNNVLNICFLKENQVKKSDAEIVDNQDDSFCGYLLENTETVKFCADKNVKCEFWASTGECTNNPDYMLIMCCKSCSSISDCINQHRYCKYWASIGECEENPDYMETKCCKSCREQNKKRIIL